MLKKQVKTNPSEDSSRLESLEKLLASYIDLDVKIQKRSKLLSNEFGKLVAESAEAKTTVRKQAEQLQGLLQTLDGTLVHSDLERRISQLSGEGLERWQEHRTEMAQLVEAAKNASEDDLPKCISEAEALRDSAPVEPRTLLGEVDARRKEVRRTEELQKEQMSKVSEGLGRVIKIFDGYKDHVKKQTEQEQKRMEAERDRKIETWDPAVPGVLLLSPKQNEFVVCSVQEEELKASQVHICSHVADYCHCVLAGKAVYITGGVGEEARPLKDAYRVDVKVDLGAMRRVSDMLVGRKCHTLLSVSSGQEIVAIGGEDTSRTMADCECYNITSDSWRSIRSLNRGKKYVSACVFNAGGDVYAFGGAYGKEADNSIEMLQWPDPNPSKPNWEPVEISTTESPAIMCCGVYPRKDDIVLFGGLTHKIYTFDPKKKRMAECAHSLPSAGIRASPRFRYSTQCCDGMMLLLVGDNKMLYELSTGEFVCKNPREVFKGAKELPGYKSMYASPAPAVIKMRSSVNI